MSNSTSASFNHSENIAVSAILAIVGIFGLLANITVIVCVRQNPILRNGFGLLCFSHSLANLGVMLVFLLWVTPMTLLRMSYYALSNVLHALVNLQAAVSFHPRSRPYVRREHRPYLETRFRLFDEYMITRRPQAFREFIRLLPDEFEELYQRIGSGLEHPRNHVGHITGRQRLMIYLRFVTQRISFSTYALDIGMGRTTISYIVAEVTDAVINGLHDQAFPPITRERFEGVAAKTQERFDYPRAVGFMDGKHINIKKPIHSGSIFWNYKHYYSIILLAIADADCRIMAYDIGAPGRAGDAGVFRDSNIKIFLERRSDLFPPTTELGNVGPVQYHILVDGGFGQSFRFVRPYRQREADTPEKRRFNSKLSRARRIIESTFGLLAQRFQILMTRINLEPDRVRRLVVSLMTLHNLLPRRQDSLEGVQRYESAPNGYDSLEMEGEDGADSANLARDRLTRYFMQREENPR